MFNQNEDTSPLAILGDAFCDAFGTAFDIAGSEARAELLEWAFQAHEGNFRDISATWYVLGQTALDVVNFLDSEDQKFVFNTAFCEACGLI